MIRYGDVLINNALRNNTDNTGTGSEQTPSMATSCVRPDSQAVIHWRISFRYHNTPAYMLVFEMAPDRKPLDSP